MCMLFSFFPLLLFCLPVGSIFFSFPRLKCVLVDRSSNTRKNKRAFALSLHTSLSRLTRGMKKKNCLKMMQRRAKTTTRRIDALMTSAKAKRCMLKHRNAFFACARTSKKKLFFRSKKKICLCRAAREKVQRCLSSPPPPFLTLVYRVDRNAALKIRAESIFVLL